MHSGTAAHGGLTTDTDKHVEKFAEQIPGSLKKTLQLVS